MNTLNADGDAINLRFRVIQSETNDTQFAYVILLDLNALGSAPELVDGVLLPPTGGKDSKIQYNIGNVTAPVVGDLSITWMLKPYWLNNIPDDGANLPDNIEVIYTTSSGTKNGSATGVRRFKFDPTKNVVPLPKLNVQHE